MKVRVERCWLGNNYMSFRLEFKYNGRVCRESIVIPEEKSEWTRARATEAKNMISALYNVQRSSIRFV